MTKKGVTVFAAMVAIGISSSASAQLSKSLSRIDKNEDGKLTVEEWSSEKPSLLRKIDKNKDGLLTRDEALSYYGKSAGQGDPGAVRRADGVMRADANGDQKVDLNELNAKAAVDFKGRDKDGDGFISDKD